MSAPSTQGPGAPPAVDHRHGTRVGTFAGVPIYLARTWPLLLLLVLGIFGTSLAQQLPGRAWLGYLIALVYALLLAGSVFVHEAAHTAVARRCGYRVDRIVLDVMGGHTAYDAAEATPGRTALIAVAGPAANIALAGLGLAAVQVAPAGPPHLLALGLLWVNLLLGLFNLLPGLPLDGGFLVDALVWRVTGRRSAGLVVAGWAGRVVGLLVVAWIVWEVAAGRRGTASAVWGLLIAWFLWQGATQAVRAGQARQALATVPLRSALTPAVGLPADAPVALLEQVSGYPGAVQVVTTDAAGEAVGIVDPAALALVPLAARPVTPLSAVTSAIAGDWTMSSARDADVTGLIEVVQARSLAVVAVREPGGPVYGIVDQRSLDSGLRRHGQ